MNLPSPAELVPHQGEALLLDRIDSADSGGLVASLTVRSGSPYSLANGALAGWSGPEIMAQAVSAFATLHAGPPWSPKPGLLLGLRAYRSEAEEFPPGACLAVEARESTRDAEGRGVFDCRIRMNEKLLASGTLTVFQPDNAWEILREQME
ncbi:MAG: 3-hydroxylacyl-ACP dehydratase [Steroidobacteraceae bacterium]|nr:3-hydroxylacyl-ACP dehydratase [Steroidobacteraceae bacterium]MBM2854904.1 3-hydroxylacyl-ACP dehydratase [Steroidobacteraceae bacterium]